MFERMLREMLSKKTQQYISMKLFVDRSTISRKANGKSKIMLDEAIEYARIQGLPPETICKYCPVKNRRPGPAA